MKSKEKDGPVKYFRSQNSPRKLQLRKVAVNMHLPDF